MSRVFTASTTTYTCDTTEGNCDEFDIADHVGGLIFIPSGAAATGLQFWVKHPTSGTYYHVPDADLTVTANKAYPIPLAVFGARYVKVVTNSGSFELSFILKS